MKPGDSEESLEPVPSTGTVTSIVAQARRPDRVSVHLDGRFAFALPTEVAAACCVRPGSVIDASEFGRLAKARNLHDAKQRALALLSRRPMSEAEVRSRLERADHVPETVDEVIGRLRELGYLDDAEFASAYASSRMRSRGYGPRRILAELRRRGIEDRLAQSVIAGITADSDPSADAMRAAERVWPRYARETDRRKRDARLYGFLARRGFDHETIQGVIGKLESTE